MRAAPRLLTVFAVGGGIRVIPTLRRRYEQVYQDRLVVVVYCVCVNSGRQELRVNFGGAGMGTSRCVTVDRSKGKISAPSRPLRLIDD